MHHESAWNSMGENLQDISHFPRRAILSVLGSLGENLPLTLIYQLWFFYSHIQIIGISRNNHKYRVSMYIPDDCYIDMKYRSIQIAISGA